LTSLLALLDDIATVLDDVAAMTKVAAKKTAGVLGDDLALNAQQVSGVTADRELPVVWAVAKGSFTNKLILVPSALAISAVTPWAVTPLLMFGGLFLCYEGVEKLAHQLLPHQPEEQAHRADLREALADPTVEMVAFEASAIKGAIRTDFVLSAEIIVITLGTVATAAFGTQVAVLAGIAVIMTVGVYGLVAGIVKLDDAGLSLSRKQGNGGFPAMQRGIGRAFVLIAPSMMRGLSIVGTAAMFMVGGGILLHGMPVAPHWVAELAQQAGTIPALGGLLEMGIPTLLDAVAGVVAGALALAGVTLAGRLPKNVRKTQT